MISTKYYQQAPGTASIPFHIGFSPFSTCYSNWPFRRSPVSTPGAILRRVKLFLHCWAPQLPSSPSLAQQSAQATVITVAAVLQGVPPNEFSRLSQNKVDFCPTCDTPHCDSIRRTPRPLKGVILRISAAARQGASPVRGEHVFSQHGGTKVA